MNQHKLTDPTVSIGILQYVFLIKERRFGGWTLFGLPLKLKFGRALLLIAALAIAVPTLFGSAAPIRAEGETIRIVSSTVTSEFPEGMRFRVDANSDNEISAIAVRFRIGQQTRGVYDYMDLSGGDLVEGELFWRTNSSGRYIPPGTIITYNFEIEDTEANRLDTEPVEFIYQDARFEWEEVSEGPLTVAYHGPVKTRAESVLEAMLITLDFMGPVLGADTTEPIRTNMYNNVKEMLEALPPGSATIRRELITEGQAFVDIGTLLVLAGRQSRGTASHEMTHILTHRAGDSVFRNVPQWLDEGLSEYGNIEPGFSYDIALEFAIATDRLLPITSMPALPGTPEDVIIFYGQGRSIVRFMVDGFGPDKMRELMATLKSGKNVDDAIEEVYGMSRLDLENIWRRAVGAPELSLAERSERLEPTPIPRREILPFSLTPQAGGQTVAAMSDDSSESSTEQPQEADTPTPEPTATSVPEPSVPEAPVPSTPAVEDGGSASASDPSAESGETPTGGSCAVPVHGAPRVVETSFIAMLVGLVGLRFRRRFRP